MGGCGAIGRRAGTVTDKLRLTVKITHNPLAEMREENARSLVCSRIGENPGYRCGREGLVAKPPPPRWCCCMEIGVPHEGSGDSSGLPIELPRREVAFIPLGLAGAAM